MLFLKHLHPLMGKSRMDQKCIFGMKKLLSIVLIGAFLFGTFSCEDNKETAPEIPPYESMAVDFSQFTTENKSAGDTTQLNYVAAGLTVFVWNVTLSVTLAVPLTVFYHSFQYEPEFMGDATWEWKYDGTGLANTYKARLVGKVMSDVVQWQMFISKEGINAHEEFLWFEGTSNLAGDGGQWTLYHSYTIQEAVLQIDWEKTGDEIGNIQYTYIRESDNGDPNQLTDGSYLTYGLQDDYFNAFYNIQFNNRNEAASAVKNVNIEWSTTEYYGRIMAPHYYQGDDSWHCWDNMGYDMVCTE